MLPHCHKMLQGVPCVISSDKETWKFQTFVDMKRKKCKENFQHFMLIFTAIFGIWLSAICKIWYCVFVWQTDNDRRCQMGVSACRVQKDGTQPQHLFLFDGSLNGMDTNLAFFFGLDFKKKESKEWWKESRVLRGWMKYGFPLNVFSFKGSVRNEREMEMCVKRESERQTERHKVSVICCLCHSSTQRDFKSPSFFPLTYPRQRPYTRSHLHDYRVARQPNTKFIPQNFSVTFSRNE